MAIKKCLMKGEMTKVNKVVDKRKPATRKDQRFATKQEEIFDRLTKDKDFMKKLETLSPKNKIRAFQVEFERNRVTVSQAKIKRMLKGDIGVKIPEPKIPKIPKPEIPAKPISPVAKPPKFIEAKTLAEAKIEWSKYCHGSFPIDDYAIKGWSEKKKLKIMNLINNQMHDMQPWLRGRKIGKFTIEDGDSQWNGGIFVRKSLENNSLRLNYRMKFIDPTKREGFYGSLKSGRWTVSGENAAVTFRHEMGHGMWYDSKLIDPNPSGNFVRRFFDLDKRIIKRNISEYATENAAEFFAETFSLYSSPEYITGSLNKVFGEGFEELIEKILIAGTK